MKTCIMAFWLFISCLAYIIPVKADQNAIKASPKLHVTSESDILGDWQTLGEGWRIIFKADHTAFLYSEGYAQLGPFPSVWKLVGNEVVVSDAASGPFRGFFGRMGGSLVIISYKNDFVLLPKNELPVAEKRGFAVCGCLWRSSRKNDKSKY